MTLITAEVSLYAAESVTALARIWGVSETAAAGRLLTLGLQLVGSDPTPASVVRWWSEPVNVTVERPPEAEPPGTSER